MGQARNRGTFEQRKAAAIVIVLERKRVQQEREMLNRAKQAKWAEENPVLAQRQRRKCRLFAMAYGLGLSAAHLVGR